jgi:nucleoside-diphosphate-sugar epimerase
MRVLITGTNGFVGGRIQQHLRKNSDYHCEALNRPFEHAKTNIDHYDVLIHCAGLAHLPKNQASYDDYYKANVEQTQAVLKIAAAKHVKHFIFISTIGVLGNQTKNNDILNDTSIPVPYNDYSKTKHEAEKIVQDSCTKHHIEFSILRPVLICGLKADGTLPPGNVGKLMQAIKWHLPLPFADIHNKRAILRIETLCDWVGNHLNQAINRSLICAEENMLSTAEIATLIGGYIGKKPVLFSLPQFLQKKLGHQLYGDLNVKPVMKK